MQLVDTERYPIDRLDTPEGKAFVAASAAQFASTATLLLPGFLTPEAVATMATETLACLDKRYRCRSEHNVFLDDGSSAIGEDGGKNDAAVVDPRTRPLRTSVASIANDHLGADDALRQLYAWPALTSFIGAVLGCAEFHRGADPLGALSINVYEAGDCHEWHFDESRFSVTLMVQESERGGYFEYVSGLCTDDGADIDGIGQVLDGDVTKIERLPFVAGSLSIFGGRNTLHRVTEVSGDRPRLVPVLTYDTVPGSVNSERVRTLFWGRTG